MNPVGFLLVYFASCLTGVSLFNRSPSPAVSFVGYNMVVVPFGFVVNLVVSRYDPALVLEVIQITAVVTVGMMVVGTLVPGLFNTMYAGLTIALVLTLVVEAFQIVVLHVHSGWIDWLVAGTFCGYIGYDWGRANRIPKSLDNAIDSAAAIYMDVINLFLRVLRLRRR